MIEKVRRYIEQNELLGKETTHIVTLSGGADSVVLLRLMLQMGYRTEVAHCNFHLRGEESNRDEEFCTMLCKELGVPLHIVHFDTMTYAQLHKISIEMAARNLRYSYFHRLREDIGAESICVAHHKDDNAETILMNIIRGTGLQGLTGIRPKNGCIIRPLLCVTRSEIEDYLTVINQPYITDSSNLVNDVTRNKIRLDIMPMLRNINPSINETLSSMAQHVIDGILFTKDGVERWRDRVYSDSEGTIDLALLRECPSPRFLLFQILSEHNISSSLIEQISHNINAQTGTEWHNDTHTIIIDRGKLVIEKTRRPFNPLVMPIEGRYIAEDKSLIIERKTTKDIGSIDRSPTTATIDAKAIQFPLTLRQIQQGDSFTPLGMKGKKLVSDFLTDRKLSLLEKRRQLCVTDATGKILWIVGQRIDHKIRITDDTINCIVMRYC